MESNDEIGVGPTEELSLRVSVASLVRVLFAHPKDGRTMLALERTATLREVKGQPEVTVRANPFGGAVRITDPDGLKALIGNFHYDSIRSRQERDFRIQLRPAAWEKVKQVCRDHLKTSNAGILDSNPERELAEEFEESLNLNITSKEYRLIPRGILVEDLPTATENVRAEGRPTVRIYQLFETWMAVPEIINIMLANSREFSDEDLEKLAWEDAQRGGKGRANAILVLDLDELTAIDPSEALQIREGPIWVNEHQLDRSVLAILG